MTAEVQPMTERDYSSEMSEFLAANQPKGDVIASVHAQKIVRKLMQRDPDLLQGWLMQKAVPLLADDMMRRLNQSRRTNVRRKFSQAISHGD